MLSERLLEVGTAYEHLTALLRNWNDSLRVLEDRYSDTQMSDDTKKRFALTRETIRLLTDYLDKQLDSPSDTCYIHLTELYSYWQEGLEQARRFNSTACKELTAQLLFSTDLLYRYIAEDSSDYELLKLVNSAG